MLQYHIWTIGCQMNKAEAQRIAGYLELFGYQYTPVLKSADIVILNTCVVRQNAERKVLGTLSYLKGIKNANPKMSILVTGCFVDSRIKELERFFPHVTLFFRPGAYAELLSWAQKQGINIDDVEETYYFTNDRISPCAFVPIIQGCDNFCSYCVVPYRRGREKSRTMEEILCEVNKLVEHGAREVTLLGQNVNSYGHDLPAQPDLGDLLIKLGNIDGLFRIRFLTNHPKDMSQKLIETIASLDNICEHISLPIQSGDDDILKAMRRGYTVEQYRGLVNAMRNHVSEVALSTDLIVGFPGETEEQFGYTLALLDEIRFDTVHVAAYSPRPDTAASKEYDDTTPIEVKKNRLNRVEALQARIADEINSKLRGRKMEILVEGQKGKRWYGRTRSDKLVFFNSNDCVNYTGQLADVKINKTSPWALQGEVEVKDLVKA